MSDLTSERIAAIELIIEEYQRLVNHNPEKEEYKKLLSYLFDVNSDGFRHSPNKIIQDEFFNRYLNDKTRYVCVMYTAYLIDLMKANDQIEGIDRFPKKELPKPEYKPIVKSIEDTLALLDDDIPF